MAGQSCLFHVEIMLFSKANIDLRITFEVGMGWGGGGVGVVVLLYIGALKKTFEMAHQPVERELWQGWQWMYEDKILQCVH